MSSPNNVDLLILGAGWTSTFLIPLLRARHITFAATTRDGRTVAGTPTLKWRFDPNESSSGASGASGGPHHKNQFSALPRAGTVLIAFPLTGKGASTALVYGYAYTHPPEERGVRFVQLGSTGIWQGGRNTTATTATPWITRHSPYDTQNARAVAEDELRGLGGCVLNLAGLWGGERDARKWVDRVAKTKEEVKGKKSLHMVHGEDVARAIVAVAQAGEKGGEKVKGQRYMVTDGFVYDWWSLFAGWADVADGDGAEDGGERMEKEKKEADREPKDQAKWVYELMREEGVRALPRSMETLGRCYDGREFWDVFGLTPLRARI